MARLDSRLHDQSMDNTLKRPRKGDRVQINGFLGAFEVVQVAQDGSTADVRHVGSHGPDYIEKDILSHELIYPTLPNLFPQ